jgi:hypothetical protein
MATNLQTFAGEVEIPDGNLQLKRVLELSANTSTSSNTGILISRTLGASSDSNVIVYFDEDQPALRIGHTVNAASDNVILMDTGNNFTMNIFGDVEASFFKGDGGLLSNLVTDFQSVSEFGASTDQQVTLSNLTTGLNVSVGNVVVAGNVTATTFIGDGSQLDNIASSLEEIVINGNVTSNIMELRNATSLVTTGMVGVGNLFPEHTLSVGSNLWVDDARTDGNTLSVQGNAYISHKLTLGSIEILPGYNLQQTSNLGNTTTNTLEFNNATTAFVTSKMAGIGIEPSSADVGVAGLHVDGHLRLGGPANTDENSDIYLRTAGALNLNANDTDTDNQYTGLVMRAGNSNESNITIEGALSDATKQHITFATRNTERMRIDEYGNVSIGTSDDSNYMLNVAGEANCVKLTTTSLQINTIPLSIIYQLDDILENGNVTTNVATFGKVSVSDPTVATTASNLVTWNSTTQEFEDSGGLISNKLSIVSEQPPSALSANTTSVANHGTYTLTTSGLATNSNTWNAFDDDSANAWVSVDIYKGASNVYDGTVQLAATTGLGEWLAVELPYKATLRYLKLTPSSVASYPTDANLYATNDSVTWELLKEWTGVTPGSDTEEQTVFVDASDAYKKYAIVPTKVAGDSITVAIQEWKMFCESFTVDGGKVKMATSAVTGGETVVDQTSAHARESAVLKKYPEVALSSTSGVEKGYTFSVSSQYTSYHPYKAFDGQMQVSQGWSSATGLYNYTSPWAYTGSANLGTDSGGDATNDGEYIQIELPNKILLNHVALCVNRYTGIQAFTLYGSNNGVSWTELLDDALPSSIAYDNWQLRRFDVNTTTYYKHFGLVAKTGRGEVSSHTYVTLQEWELYGYEEIETTGDTSLDTTITSKYNTPDLTNASFYIDGLRGSTATDHSGSSVTVTENNVTWDSTEKAWILSGAANSNVVSGDLGFEGFQPHTVSMWVKADQYTGELFHLGTATNVFEHKSSVRFTETNGISWGGNSEFALSNAQWHNVTFTHDSRANERKLYVDGRLLDSAQVGDTTTRYPPMQMTDYANYAGYTVSASSEYDTSYRAYEAFNWIYHNQGDTVGADTWLSENAANYGGTDYLYNKSPPRNLGTGAEDGEWIKLGLPHKIHLSHIKMWPRLSHLQRFPEDFIVYGSNDNENWTSVLSVTGYSVEDESNPSEFTADVDAGAYRYFGLVVRKLKNSDYFVAIAEIQLYGHDENDLVRFPFRTVNGKYPPMNLGGKFHRHFEVSGGDGGYPGQTHKVFDGAMNSLIDDISWQTPSNQYNSSGVYTGSQSLTIDGTSRSGHYVALKMPYAVKASEFHLFPGWSESAFPSAGYIAGSNDGSTWYTLLNFTSVSSIGVGRYRTLIPNTNTSNYYKHIAILVTNTQSSPYQGRCALGELEIYGVEENQDVFIRVGDGFNGKIRNLRVYKEALPSDKIQEIFDADKDEFDVGKSTVTVYQGHLGVGTTTPPAALTVMDEASEAFEEFPPGALISYERYFENHGTFMVKTSCLDSSDTTYGAFKLFAKNPSSFTYWNERCYEGSAPYEANVFAPVTGGLYSGSWAQLQCPYGVNLTQIWLSPRPNYPQLAISAGFLLGSNDEQNWSLIHEMPSITQPANYEYTKIEIPAYQGYHRFLRLVCSKLDLSLGGNNSDMSWQQGEIRYFGTRERGMSTLHDGKLKLTRSLQVEKIGPDLAYIPHRDKLYVEWATSCAHNNGTAVDTGPYRRNGTFNGGAFYHTSVRAFLFDGSGDYISTGVGTDFYRRPFTFSAWVKMTDANEIPFGSMGSWGASGRAWYLSYADSSSTMYIVTYSANFTYNSVKMYKHRWYHITTVYHGGPLNENTVQLYIDGVRQIASGTPNSPQFLELAAGGNTTLYLGYMVNGDYDAGFISDFRAHLDVGLNEAEVMAMYRLGRNPDPPNYLRVINTQVSIGNVRAATNPYHLDVAGRIRAGSSLATSFTGQHKCVPSDATGMEEGLIVSADRNNYVSLNSSELKSGKSAIQIDESLPFVSLSNVSQDKRCFGVISTIEKSNTLTRTETYGGVTSESDKILGDNRVIVNSLGEGGVWVCDAGGNLESGDYITTSNVSGYGMAQSDDLLHSYTVAKVTCDCDFSGTPIPVMTTKKEETLTETDKIIWEHLEEHKKVSNVRTGYMNTITIETWSNLSPDVQEEYYGNVSPILIDYTDGFEHVSIEEWSNLAPGEQIMYSANTHTEVVDYTKFIDVGEWSNLEANVQNTFSETEVVTYYRKEWGGNVLDDRGNLIWEDKTGEFEAPYKMRFLDATGAQTDEANCVYRAAFVGCTYHCG